MFGNCDLLVVIMLAVHFVLTFEMCSVSGESRLLGLACHQFI